MQWTHDSLLVLKASPSGVSEEVGLLKTLATALYENGPLLDASLHSLLLALFQSKLSSKTSPDTHYATLLCLHNLVLKTTGQKYASLHQSVLDIVLSYLQLSSATFSTPTETRNLIRAWKLVPVLLTESKGGFLQKAFPLVESILRLIKQHLFAIPMEQLVANSSGLDSFGDIQAVSPPHSSFIPLIESPNPEASLASRRTAFVKLQYQVLLCLSSMAKVRLFT